MTNLLDYRPVNRPAANKILRQLKAIEKINPNLGGFSIYTQSNGRGDYGQRQEYSYKGIIFFILDMDGAHIDLRYYVNPRMTDNILKQMLADARHI